MGCRKGNIEKIFLNGGIYVRHISIENDRTVSERR